MSAGSLSYSGLTNYGKVTLPSVDSWGTNMNILRDPPKSITTRKIDKVSDTSSITNMVDGSGDRVCEAISLYARGVNPSVSVSYNNFSNNAGSRQGSVLGQGQAYLPYRVARDGAFRPPIVTAYQSMPLSRQPRVNTQAFTNKAFPDFAKKLITPGGKFREVQDRLKACIRPTITYKIEKPIENFEVKYIIKDPVKFDKAAGVSGKRTMDLTTLENLDPSNGIQVDKLDVIANTNLVGPKKDGEVLKETGQYTQEALKGSFTSNRNRSIQVTSIDDIVNMKVRTKEIRNISYQAPKSKGTREAERGLDPVLKRKTPIAQAITNKRLDIYKKPEFTNAITLERNRPVATLIANKGNNGVTKVDMISSRNKKLRQKVRPGEWSGKASKPLNRRVSNGIPQTFQGNSMNQKVLSIRNSRQNRF